MISLLIILVLAWTFYLGYSRGIILQTYYSLASLISLALATANYKGLSKVLFMWIPYSNAAEGTTVNYYQNVNIFELDKVYYYGVAFFALYLLSYLVFRFLGILIHFFNLERFDSFVTHSIAGIMALLVASFSILMILMIFAAVPYVSLQNYLADDLLANAFIRHYPILSSYLNGLWTIG
ncbi:CvpA family protein [Streptococcus loxodontisalivarius]|uniref:Membrane protein required for colicin V production n=1 Tax=Streptococcus loxodontisalivarius TaxID=1349415 RepID=A0ABS2PTL8_9STRE|nr:CvpA family protein [Streptococcus loxodontisalivarius]MBM7642712.1 putative membrane protein required for colicin V production [Streptococcus loxodontisalivarius]